MSLYYIHLLNAITHLLFVISFCNLLTKVFVWYSGRAKLPKLMWDQLKKCKLDLELDSECFSSSYFLLKQRINEQYKSHTWQRNQKQVKCLVLMVRLATISKRWGEGGSSRTSNYCLEQNKSGGRGEPKLLTLLCFALLCAFIFPFCQILIHST